MRIKYYARGKFYQIECPAGSTVIREVGATRTVGHVVADLRVVRFRERDIAVPSEPEALPRELAEAGRLGPPLVEPPAASRTSSGSGRAKTAGPGATAAARRSTYSAAIRTRGTATKDVGK